MANPERIREKVLLGASDANIDFGDFRKLLVALGFTERTKGSHHIFTKSGVEEIVNTQPQGKQGEPYQIKQVRNIILKYRLEV